MDPTKTSKITDIDFHYLKMSSYRTYHVDGFFGGLTPPGFIYIDLFLERLPTPTMVKQKVNETGELGEEIIREGKLGVIREIECGLVMNITAAKALRGWLDQRIGEFETLFGGQKKND